MTDVELKKIKKRTEDAFKAYTKTRNYKIIPTSLTTGKIYEAFVLSVILKNLKNKEGLFIVLKNDSNLKLKSAPGKIIRINPHFDLYKSKADYLVGEHTKFGEVWTDIEFTSLSYGTFRKKRKPNSGEFHEVDIVVTKPYSIDRPSHDEVLLAVECKNTSYGKNLLREILGVRRELSLLARNQNTAFTAWPSMKVNASPASCLLVYSTSRDILNFSSPGNIFSIDFYHAPIV